MASIISAGTTSATALNMSADTSGVLQLASNNGTVALTVNTSQNVGIGTSSPTQKLEVSGRVLADSMSVSSTVFLWSQNRMSLGASIGLESQQSTPLWMMTNTTQPIVFGTNSTERMRIDSSGNVTMPYQPVVVLQTNSAQSIGGGATFKPTNIRMNVGSNYNGTTGQFTCPVAGVYRVWWAGNYYVTGTFSYSCVIRKNSVNTAWSYDHANSSGDWVGGAYEYILSCAAGDTLDIYSSQTWVCDGSTYWGMGFQLIG